ncbi:MAG: carbon monoxide dehydrogenase subunit G [Arenicellales bacterium]
MTPPISIWDSLVSVDVLKQCIPGCQSMERTGDNEYALTMKSKVGPVSATFKGELGLRDIVPGESYTLEFNGSGGAGGFSKGSAAVRFEPGSEGTHLHYTVDAKIGGKITQIGQRLVDGAARKMADDFFPASSGSWRLPRPRRGTGERNRAAPKPVTLALLPAAETGCTGLPA